MNHSPGPWKIYQGWVHDKESGFVANASGDTAEEQESNLRLIAAAPELLAFIQAGAAGHWDTGLHAKEEAQAILARLGLE